jgi:hypothetical protein
MGKRSDFVRVERDYYPTPADPVMDLSPFIADMDGFCEPCVGDGALADTLTRLGHRLALACDLTPLGPAKGYATARDALTLTKADCRGFTHFVTNPPWPALHARGEPTLSLIRHLSKLRPTWLLLSSDFAHNAYAPEVLAYCSTIVSVGRVKWIPDSDNSGKDNAAWYLFDRSQPQVTIFFPRGRREPIYSRDIETLIGRALPAELEALL